MSITDPKSVLVIGAGTSKQYGIPDGNELFELIVDQLGKELKQENLSQVTGNAFHILRDKNYSIFEHSPIMGSLLVSLGDDFIGSFQEAREIVEGKINLALDLLKRLTNQTSETIDDFIFQNPDLAGITKIAVATIIFNRLYTYEHPSSYKLRSLDVRKLKVGEKPDPSLSGHFLPVEERNWVHLFINLVREGVRKKHESPDSEKYVSPDNKVQVISFNYDMILEHILDKQFMNTSAKFFSEGDKWQNYIEVLHVHGKFEGMGDSVSNPYDVILDWADSITVIHDEEPQEYIKSERSRAKEVMLTSNQVYGTGFSFSKSNAEMIGLVDRDHRRGGISIYYSNYDGDYGLNLAMKNYEKEGVIVRPRDGKIHGIYSHSVNVQESSNSGDKLMSTVNWFYSGVPGRLPS